MRRLVVSAVLIASLAGCAGKKEPVKIHGKSVRHWVAELKQADPRARKKAVAALRQVGNTEPVARQGLIDSLADRDQRVRDEAVLALLQIGPDAKDALPALETAKNDRDPTVRAHANKAIERIRGK